MKKVQLLLSKNFKKYGKLIEYPAREKKGQTRNLWRIVHTSLDKTGWRVAYLVLRDKTIGRMECHSDSDETFEPLKGRGLIFVSSTKNLEDIECFYLDKPLIVLKGVWHGVISLTDEVDIKIMENAQVTCQYWPLGFRMERENFEETHVLKEVADFV